jgi:hypothetical protein
VLLLFAFLGIAALVTDVGFAILARRQMQGAVETASLEGLRGRDAPGLVNADQTRRSFASLLASNVFDDDLNPANGDQLSFGAGPVLPLTGGVPLTIEGGGAGDPSQLLASQSMPSEAQIRANPNSFVYKPVLQSNVANTAAGDMASGTYASGDLLHQESSDYSRSDFTPGTGASAFLVRIRRSRETFAAGAGVASNGPELPYLFARGTLLSPVAKMKGVTVRTTGIANARAATTIGTASTAGTDLVDGLASFAVERSTWNANFGKVVKVPLSAAGGIAQTLNSSGLLSVGFRIDSLSGGSFVPATANAIYVPLFDVMTDQSTVQNVVVAFGRIVVGSASGDASSVTFQSDSSWIAPGDYTDASSVRHHSNVSTAPQPIPTALRPTASGLIQQAFTANSGLTPGGSASTGIVFAPASVRATGTP